MNDHDLGKCCNCDNAANVENILMLPYRAPESGKGWGCFVCKSHRSDLPDLCAYCGTVYSNAGPKHHDNCPAEMLAKVLKGEK